MEEIENNQLTISFPQLPPSENKIRIIRVIRGRPAGMAYTKDATHFKKDFKKFALGEMASKIVNFSKGHTLKSTYQVHISLHFTEDQIINKGWPKTKTYFKKMDVGNRRKLLEDCLAEVTGIDDMYTFDLRMTKKITAGEPFTLISIVRITDEFEV